MSIKPIEKKQRLLVVDPSASHLAFVICEIDPSQSSMTIIKAGMLWTHDKWSLGKRLNYMKTNFLFLMKEFNIDRIYTEQFFMNPKMLTGGTAVIPTINAILQMCIDELSKDIAFEEIPPPSWRAILKIKPIMSKGKRDYKTPTKDCVVKRIDAPTRTVSNITLKERDTPSDIYDALAIVLALTESSNCNNLLKGDKIFNDSELIMRLRDKSDEDIMKGRFFGNGKD